MLRDERACNPDIAARNQEDVHACACWIDSMIVGTA